MTLEKASMQEISEEKVPEHHSWTKPVIAEFTRRQEEGSKVTDPSAFPLIASSIYAEEIVAAVDSEAQRLINGNVISFSFLL